MYWSVWRVIKPPSVMKTEKTARHDVVCKIPNAVCYWVLINLWPQVRKTVLGRFQESPINFRINAPRSIVLPCGLETHAILHREKERDNQTRSTQNSFDVEYIYGFDWWGSASKVDDVTAYPEPSQDGGRVTMATLWQQQHGGYALLWKRFLHLQQHSHRLNFFSFYFCEN